MLFIIYFASCLRVICSNWGTEQVARADLVFRRCEITAWSIVSFLSSVFSQVEGYFLCAHPYCLLSLLYLLLLLHHSPKPPFFFLTLYSSPFASLGCSAVWWRQPEESAGEGEAGCVSHATLHPSGLSEPSPRHDWSGCLQKTNGQFRYWMIIPKSRTCERIVMVEMQR